MTRPRWQEASTAGALLAGFIALMVLAGIAVVAFAAPAPLGDLILIWALTVAAVSIGWAITVAWRRITRTRRQYRSSG